MQASLSTLVQNKRLQTPGSTGGDGIHPLLGVPAPATRDAGTETPLHFVEKNIGTSFSFFIIYYLLFWTRNVAREC